MSKPEVTILMPCLNEALTIGTCIEKALKNANTYSLEVLIADNGSTDGSQQIAESMGAKVVYVAEKGYGNALIAGIKAANGKYIVMGDADDSYDFTNITPFIEKLQSGYDLVMGNRFKGGIKKGAMPFLHKYLGNPVLSLLGRIFFSSKVGDFHCGLRAFTKQAAEAMDLKSGGMEFASEMVVKASILGMKITEVPVILYPDGRNRPPHLNTWRDGWRHLKFLLIYAPNWLFLYPGLLILLLGLIFSVTLTYAPLKLGAVVLDVHTLLFANAFVIIGVQMIAFYVFSRHFASDNQLINRKKYSILNVDKVILMGVILMAVGIGISIYNLYDWSQKGFGMLEPTTMLRRVIPGISSIIIGFQLVIYSFFYGIIKK